MFAHFARRRFGDSITMWRARVTRASLTLSSVRRFARNFRRARAHVYACDYVRRVTYVCTFRFPWGIRALSTAPSCHAGTIELLRLIAPTSPSRPTRKWNEIECGSVDYRVEVDIVFYFLFFNIIRFRNARATRIARSCEFNSRSLRRVSEISADRSLANQKMIVLIKDTREEHLFRIGGANPNCRLDLFIIRYRLQGY